MAEAKREELRLLLASLPAEVRVRRYRQKAAEALQRAASSEDPALKASHVSLASGWQVLAHEIERANGLSTRPAEDNAADRDDNSHAPPPGPKT